MRAAWAIASLAILLVAAAADARKGRDGGKDGDGILDGFLAPPDETAPPTATEDAPPAEGASPLDVVADPLPEPVDADSAPSRSIAAAAMGAPALGGLVALAIAGAALLSAAAWLARRSRRQASSRPPKRSYEHGRRLGRLTSATDETAAKAALTSAPVGTLDHFQARAGETEVVIVRKKSQPCALVAGFLAGVYESVWADEVVVDHAACAGEKGGACQYVVRRAPRGAIGSGSPAGAASTRGSATVLRRSPPARLGGG